MKTNARGSEHTSTRSCAVVIGLIRGSLRRTPRSGHGHGPLGEWPSALPAQLGDWLDGLRPAAYCERIVSPSDRQEKSLATRVDWRAMRHGVKVRATGEPRRS